MENPLINYDFSVLFDQDMNPVIPPQSPEEEQMIKDAHLEEVYQRSGFSKLWASTRKIAIEKTLKAYKDAKKVRDDWASRVYQKTNIRVLVHAHDDYRRREVNVYEANERRRTRNVESAQRLMDEAIRDLRELSLSTEEINSMITKSNNTKQLL